MSRFASIWAGVALAVALAALGACDSGFEGSAFGNRAPETRLSVRDTSLVDNLEGDDRLTSTVHISWSGTDPDGFVSYYEMRYYGSGTTSDGSWNRTTRNDSLVLLPIPRGERIADVVFEVRAVDDDGLADPTPARTVFPIQNSPPTIRFNSFELPPDTTFPHVSFTMIADDPEGLASLDRIDVSLNDSLSFVSLPPDVDFITLSGPRTGTAGEVVDASVYIGRGFTRSSLVVPGMRLGADNTLFIRSVDQTDTTSALVRFTWHIKPQTSDILFVNDYRKNTEFTMASYHLGLLGEYLPAGTPTDVWRISEPYATGNVGNTPRSDALPPLVDPTLSRMFARWKYIYWMTASSTDRISTNNLPFAATAMDSFFDAGGKLMVHSPVALPADPEEAFSNAAVLLLPIGHLIAFPDSLRPSLRLSTGAAVRATGPVPGVAATLPDLKANGFMINTLPYDATGAGTVGLYDADYRYVTRQGSRQGDWTGPSTVASISADRRVALFALPLINEANGQPLLVGTDGDHADARRAVFLLLESLGFPR